MKQYVEFGRLVIDSERINKTIDAYFKWKSLNDYIKSTSTRGMNMPDAISEPMGCYCLGYQWNRGEVVGDAYDPKTNRKIEFKATSNFEGDLSSFGPECNFDDLVYLRFDLDNDKLYIYDLQVNAEQFGRYPANKSELIRDQQMNKRRPHVSLQKLFVEANDMKPTVIFDIRRATIIEDNR